jgi:predicted nucleic acid-binding protein
MNELIVADTSCLIVLSKTGYMDLLQSLFVKVWITPEVANEFGEPLPAWIEIHTPKDYNVQLYLTTQLDTGEASAICLALQTP